MNNQLKKTLERLKEAKEILEKFTTNEEAIEYLVKETGLSKDECTNAYEIIMKLNLDK